MYYIIVAYGKKILFGNVKKCRFPLKNKKNNNKYTKKMVKMA